MSFEIENQDDSGREGVLEIDDEEIKTPNYIPNQKDVGSLVKSPYVNSDNKISLDIGEYTHWLNSNKLNNICGSRKSYNSTKYYLRSQLKKVVNAGIKKKVIHFEFNSDVETISGQQLDILFKLQDDVGADIIEVPNLFSVRDYSQVLDRAYEWRRSQGLKKELMGIANEGYDVDLLKRKIGVIDCIGANFNNENVPLLYAIKNNLKSEGIWVHAFSVPRSFRVVDWNGTMSVLMNYYGIDTISSLVGRPESSRDYRFRIEGMNEDERRAETERSKYFKPTDYGTPRCNSMNQNQKLSEFCDCPVCRRSRIMDIIGNSDMAIANLRTHEVFAYKKESDNYQSMIRENESAEYFDKKTYAREIANRFMSQS